MRHIDVALLLVYVAAMSVGQLLFKYAAAEIAGRSAAESVAGLFTSPAFLSAGALYAALAVYWTWLLGRMPLSLAYPFVALSFVVVPILGWAIFGERIHTTHVIGLILIVAGVFTIQAGH